MHTKPWPAPHCQSRGVSDARMVIVYMLAIDAAIVACVVLAVVTFVLK